jgi:hypothetical protein
MVWFVEAPADSSSGFSLLLISNRMLTVGTIDFQASSKPAFRGAGMLSQTCHSFVPDLKNRS